MRNNTKRVKNEEDMIPFATDAHTKDDFCTVRRISETYKFIDWADITNREVLDIGERNFVGMTLERFSDDGFDNTLPCDFNYNIETPKHKYDTILCLEVFEHNLNLLNFVENLRDRLRDNGILYLSTPKHHPLGFMFNETQHVAEYKPEVIRTIFEYRGFKIADYREFKTIPFWRGMRGGLLRTFFRVYFQKTMLFKLRKTK